MSTEKFKQWIWESLLLDLAQDEEIKALAKEATSGGPLNLNAAIRRFKQPPAILDFLNLESISKELMSLDDQEKYFWYFKMLKWYRVKTSLALDRAAWAYANAPNKKGFKKLREAHRRSNESLDFVALHCMGAMSSVAANISRGEGWPTLQGLFHSEACAAARQETSYGLAASYDRIIDAKAVGSKIFAWIANHNRARGLNHMNKQLDASKLLDYKVDSFQATGNIEELRGELPSLRKSAHREAILYRLLYFPAVLTLAQALEDLGRHAERRFYLRAGRNKAENVRSKYWVKIFEMKMRFSDLDTKRTLGGPKGCSQAKTNPNDILTPRQAQLQHQLCGGCEEVLCSSWRESILWLLCWHACDTDQLYERIRRTCAGCHQVLRPLRDTSEVNGIQAGSDRRVDVISRVFHHDFKLLETWIEAESDDEGSSNDSEWLRYLLGKEDNEHFPVADRRAIWHSASALYQVLQELNELKKEDPAVLNWTDNLRKLLASKVFAQFRSDNQLFETIRPKPDEESSCPAIPEDIEINASAERLNPRGTPTRCGSHGCSYRLLHLQDELSEEGKEPHESLDYFFSVMAAQQARFKLYLDERTGKWKYFRSGEAKIPSPDFELIALRRWNSFSPNLGSRGSVTVGGGYLARVYDSSADRYLGVAVDPGYNFLENLFNEGFTIPDIDLVVVTHAHPDHTENLTNLFTLLRERSKRVGTSGADGQKSGLGPKECSMLLALTEGVFERFRSHLESEKEFIRDIAVLRAEECRGNAASGNALWLWIDKDADLCHMELRERPDGLKQGSALLKIEAKKALHGDGTSHDSIGVVLTLQKEEGQDAIRLGILSDSRYHKHLSKDYAGCKVLIAHIGSLLDEKWYRDYNRDPLRQGDICQYLHASPSERTDPKAYSRRRLYSLLTKENHLYLPGLARFICEFDELNPRPAEFKPLIILSEFGEELRGGLRTWLGRRLSKISRNRPMHFMPADVGLRVDVSTGTVFCSVCHRFVEPNKIEPYSVLPSEEAMAYVCRDCQNSRRGEIDRLVEEWCHTGRPVVPRERE